MCGIGFYGPTLKPNTEIRIIFSLFNQLLLRGRDGLGYIIIHPDKGVINHFRSFTIDEIVKRLSSLRIPKGSYILLHTRARPISETIHEVKITKEFLQPIVKDNIAVVFNGIIENDEEFREDEEQWVDTFAICKHHSKLQNKALKGSYSYIYVDLKKPETINVIKGNQPLYAYVNPKTSQIIVTSVKTKIDNFFEIDLPVSSKMQINVDKIGSLFRTKYTCNYKITPITIHNSVNTPNIDRQKAVILCSGGLDSCVVAYEIAERCKHIVLLNFDYGQPASKQEWEATLKLHDYLEKQFPDKRIEAVQLKVPVIELLATQSSIFNDIPEGISAVETLSRWIPARNLIFLSLAVGYAESIGAGIVAYGGNLEEACVFPDNTTEAVEKLNKAIQWFIAKPGIEVVSPLRYDMKIDVVKKALKYGVYDISWSCDRGGEKECGQCEGCILKRKALELLKQESSYA